MDDQIQTIMVEIIFALPDQQFVQEEKVVLGTTVGDLLGKSTIRQHLPVDIQLADGKVGIFGKPVKLSQVLKVGDRVEIYRPLVNDPKEARRKKAAETKG